VSGVNGADGTDDVDGRYGWDGWNGRYGWDRRYGWDGTEGMGEHPGVTHTSARLDHVVETTRLKTRLVGAATTIHRLELVPSDGLEEESERGRWSLGTGGSRPCSAPAHSRPLSLPLSTPPSPPSLPPPLPRLVAVLVHLPDHVFDLPLARTMPKPPKQRRHLLGVDLAVPFGVDEAEGALQLFSLVLLCIPLTGALGGHGERAGDPGSPSTGGGPPLRAGVSGSLLAAATGCLRWAVCLREVRGLPSPVVEMSASGLLSGFEERCEEGLESRPTATGATTPSAWPRATSRAGRGTRRVAHPEGPEGDDGSPRQPHHYAATQGTPQRRVRRHRRRRAPQPWPRERRQATPPH